MSAANIPSVVAEQLTPIVEKKYRPALQLIGITASVVALVSIAAIGFYAGGTAYIERKIERGITDSRASDGFRNRVSEVCRDTWSEKAALAQREHDGYQATLGLHEKRIASLESAYQQQRELLAVIKSTVEATAADVREIKTARRR